MYNLFLAYVNHTWNLLCAHIQSNYMNTLFFSMNMRKLNWQMWHILQNLKNFGKYNSICLMGVQDGECIAINLNPYIYIYIYISISHRFCTYALLMFNIFISSWQWKYIWDSLHHLKCKIYFQALNRGKCLCLSICATYD